MGQGRQGQAEEAEEVVLARAVSGSHTGSYNMRLSREAGTHCEPLKPG